MKQAITDNKVLHTKRRKYIEVKGNTLIVKTPVPYMVVRQREYETTQDAENKEYSLNNACKFLYDCMRLLGIAQRQAIERNFTLNIETGEKITDIAARKEILIRNYNW